MRIVTDMFTKPSVSMIHELSHQMKTLSHILSAEVVKEILFIQRGKEVLKR